jgi:hypothetical protein
MFDYAARRERLMRQMRAEGVDALFLAPSADLEYLTGVERQIPSFGEAAYAHGWVTGAFFRPDADPVFLFPRMFAAFDLREEPNGEVIVVGETDDGRAAFERVARGLGPVVAVGDRAWAETVLELGRIVGFERLRTGSRLVKALRRVKTEEELAAMGRAIVTVERTMAALGDVGGELGGCALEDVFDRVDDLGERPVKRPAHLVGVNVGSPQKPADQIAPRNLSLVGLAGIRQRASDLDLECLCLLLADQELLIVLQ